VPTIAGPSSARPASINTIKYATARRLDDEKDGPSPLSISMKKKYAYLQSKANTNILPKKLYEFAQSLPEKLALSLLSNDFNDDVKKEIQTLNPQEKQYYICLAAIVDSDKLCEFMLAPVDRGGIFVVPNSTTTSLSFLSHDTKIASSFLQLGEPPVLTKAALYTAHALNVNSLNLLLENYEGLDELLHEGTINLLMAAIVTSDSTHQDDPKKVNDYIEKALSYNDSISLYVAQSALYHSAQSVVISFLEKSTPEQKMLLHQYALKIGHKTKLDAIIDEWKEKEKPSTSFFIS
jgi:hypothetical protein